MEWSLFRYSNFQHLFIIRNLRCFSSSLKLYNLCPIRTLFFRVPTLQFTRHILVLSFHTFNEEKWHGNSYLQTHYPIRLHCSVERRLCLLLSCIVAGHRRAINMWVLSLRFDSPTIHNGKWALVHHLLYWKWMTTDRCLDRTGRHCTYP